MLKVILEPKLPQTAGMCSRGRSIEHVRMLGAPGYKSYTIVNINARSTFETKPLLTPCPNWPDENCYYPIRPLRAVITPRAYRLDDMLRRIAVLLGAGAVHTRALHRIPGRSRRHHDGVGRHEDDHRDKGNGETQPRGTHRRNVHTDWGRCAPP